MTLMPYNNFTSSQQRGKTKTKTNVELKQLAKGCAILIGMCFIYKAQSNLQAHSNVSRETAFGATRISSITFKWQTQNVLKVERSRPQEPLKMYTYFSL